MSGSSVDVLVADSADFIERRLSRSAASLDRKHAWLRDQVTRADG